MGLFDNFPISNAYAVNLDWIMRKMREVEEFVKNYAAVNNVSYAGVWDITKQYPKWALVADGDTSWLSLQPVPKGVPLENSEYWQKLADLDPRIAGIIVQLADAAQNIKDLQSKVANLKIANVLDYGAVGDGVTDCTNAFNDAYASGLPVWVPYGDYKLTGKVTLGDCTIDGALHGGNIEITGTLTAVPSSNIFEDTTITITDVSKNPEGYPDWFGGNIQKCVDTFPKTVLLPHKYTLSANLELSKSNIALVGNRDILPSNDYGYPVPLIDVGNYKIICGKPDITVINDMPRSISVKNIAVNSGAGDAFLVAGLLYGQFDNITVMCDSSSGSGFNIYHCVATRFNRIRVQVVDAGPAFFGYFIPGETNIAAGCNASVYFTNCSVDNTWTRAPAPNNTRGFFFIGDPTDTYITDCETARCDYGIVFDLTNVKKQIQDVIIKGCVFDDCFKSCVQVFDNNSHSGILMFSDCYFAKGNYGSSDGVFTALNSNVTIMLDCQIINSETDAYAIQLSGTSPNAIIKCAMTDNGLGTELPSANISKTIVRNGTLMD